MHVLCISRASVCYLYQELVFCHLIILIPSRSIQEAPIAGEHTTCWVSGPLAVVTETLISHQTWLFDVDVLASLVKFKAWVRTATALMDLRKFWLHWLWQRIMSGFEDFKNIWGISNPFSPHKVSFQENLTVLRKTWSLLNFNWVIKIINLQTYPSY